MPLYGPQFGMLYTGGTSPSASQQYDGWVFSVHMDVLAAKAHVSKMVNILAQGDMSWGTTGTTQNVATTVISEINPSYERPLAAQNISKSGPAYAATVPSLGGTSDPSSRPALLDPQERIKGRHGVVEWLTWSSSPPENR